MYAKVAVIYSRHPYCALIAVPRHPRATSRLKRIAHATALLATICAPLTPALAGPETIARNSSALPEMPARLDHADPLVAERIRERTSQVYDMPRDPLAWIKLGQACYANGFFAEAVLAYQGALSLDENLPEVHYWLALALDRRGDREAALAATDRAARLAPTYAPARWRAGLWLLADGRLDDAEEKFNESIAVDGEDEAGWFGLARVHLARGEPEKAKAVIVQQLRNSPNGGYALQLLAAAYRQMGEPERAAELMARGLTPVPSWNDPWGDELDAEATGIAAETQRVSQLLDNGQHEAALEILERLRALWPARMEIYSYTASAHEIAGRRAEAVGALRDGIARDPSSHVLYLNLSELQYKDGAVAEALTSVERAIGLNPADASAHELRGNNLVSLGRQEDALTAYQEALSRAPHQVSALYQLGRLHAGRGEWDEAAEALERIVAMDPEATAIWGTLASVRIQLRQPDRAQAALDRAAAGLPPDHEQVRQLQGQIDLLRRGNPEGP